jgi:hypothetical protein
MHIALTWGALRAGDSNNRAMGWLSQLGKDGKQVRAAATGVRHGTP